MIFSKSIQRAIVAVLICMLLGMAPTMVPLTAHAFDCSRNWHDFIVIQRVEPAHMQDGYILSRCRICNVQFRKTLFAVGCDWGPWRTERFPTCIEEGLQVRNCGVGAGHKETRIIPALGHDLHIVETEACCTYLAQREISCMRCDYARTEFFGELLDCSYIEEITKEPTCETEGELIFSCELCGEVHTEPIPATGHDWSDWTVVLDASPGVAGLEVSTCFNCGQEKERAIPALALLQEPALSPPDPPFFGVPEAAAVGINLAAWAALFFLLSGEVTLLAWSKKKKREFLAEREYLQGGLDGYECI